MQCLCVCSGSGGHTKSWLGAKPAACTCTLSLPLAPEAHAFLAPPVACSSRPTCMCWHDRACGCMCSCACSCSCSCACVHVHVHVHVLMCMCSCSCACVHVHVFMCAQGRVLKQLLPGSNLKASILTRSTAAGTDFSKVRPLPPCVRVRVCCLAVTQQRAPSRCGLGAVRCWPVWALSGPRARVCVCVCVCVCALRPALVPSEN